MAFSFSSSTPAPASGSTPAPAPSGFNVGTAPAPAFGASAFGSSTTPAPTAPPPSFGAPTANPAPAPFGATAAPATTFGAAPASTFGAAPAPFGATAAPATTFGAAPASTFGAAPAPFGATAAPATTFGAAPASTFGAAPAPFGATAAPATTFGGAAPASTFGATPAPAPPAPAIAGTTLYNDLPPHYRKAIDQIHDVMMQHKRTLFQVQSCGPSALQQHPATTGDDASMPLPMRLERMQKQLDRLRQDIDKSYHRALMDKQVSENLTTQAYIYAKWPVEAVAGRRGIRLSQPAPAPATSGEEKRDADTATMFHNRLREILDVATATIDRIDRLPSPYLWQLLEDFQRWIGELQHQLNILNHKIEQNRAMQQEGLSITSIVEEQHRILWAVAPRLTQISSDMQQLRQIYNRYEKGENVLDKARLEEMEHKQRIEEQIQRVYLQCAQAPTASATTPAPAFGAAPGVGFGGTTGSAPAPSFSFSSTAARAPYGVTPAPATTTFGAPAPSGSMFGGSTSTSSAPSSGFGGFASAPTSTSTPVTPQTPKKKSGSNRSSGRLRK